MRTYPLRLSYRTRIQDELPDSTPGVVFVEGLIGFTYLKRTRISPGIK